MIALFLKILCYSVPKVEPLFVQNRTLNQNINPIQNKQKNFLAEVKLHLLIKTEMDQN